MSAPNERSELVREVADAVVRRLPEADETLIRKVLERFFEEMALEDFQQLGIGEISGLAASLFERMRVHERGALSVKVWNPSDHDETWGQSRTVIEVMTDDMPFLVDSLTEELKRRDVEIHLAIHPQLAVERDAEGQIQQLLSLDSDATRDQRESLMHYQIDKLTAQAEIVDLETSIHRVLRDVQRAVVDWRPMRAACSSAIEKLSERSVDSSSASQNLAETIEFLEWMVDDHFTFLGYLEFDLEAENGDQYLRPDADTGLGLLRRMPLVELAKARRPVSGDARRFLSGDRLVLVSKSNKHSTVHRDVHMDIISLKRFDEHGEVDGECRFLGLFTSMAYSIAARKIPLVKGKVRRVVERTRFLENSHNAKMLRHIVENYPRDELFQISEDDLYTFAMRLLSLQMRPRLALLVRQDEEERYVSCMVYVPRDRHNTSVRKNIEAILQRAFRGTVTSYFTRISDRPLAQLQFLVRTTPGKIPAYDVKQLEQQLTAAIRSWSERLDHALGEAVGEVKSREIMRLYGDAFPSSYQEHYSAEQAVHDIPLIEDVLERGELRIRFDRQPGASETRFHLRTFELAVTRHLSDFLPILENMGLKVASEFPFEVRATGATNPVWIRDFEVVADNQVDLEQIIEPFEEALRRTYVGAMENDGFNQLVLLARLDWRQVVLLRAYCKYLRQTGIAFSQSYMEQTLAKHPDTVVLLLQLFDQLLDPSQQHGVERDQLLLGELMQHLDNIKSLDEDRILRRFLNLVQSTLRTNFFQPESVPGLEGTPKAYVSFKFDGAKLLGLPDPRPMYEIFVFSPRVEAVHLRGGKVARGGIRWSDRREDFRTEILGLVKSQMVKNAVIVPVGAKGGFVVKRPPEGGDREAVLAEGIECYKVMIRGLLDITDNLQAGELIPSRDVVRRDGDDPYLVVAADKGTATFSDIANAMAAQYDFWLGDAFASGGSVGYDHKKMAITARGAWESVKRHFRELPRELSRDIQTTDFTCVGVGDMSGDVFGNGMLLSTHTRLVAAFNHLHIFVDPSPDAAVSFAERQRLFNLGRSSWSDYDRSLLSSGGDIFDRQEKSVTVSDEVKALLGVTTHTLAPNDLIRAILCAKVDLLWFGGIGTYVRHSEETNTQVGDRQNDELRVTAPEVRSLVVGEGANLGLTQRGRVEYALGGGRINTDFIDNSGGVDCSDHEVNIKIALRDAILAGDLNLKTRDRLLVEMTTEVAELVLTDNYLQSQAISLESAQRALLIDEHARLMQSLERAKKLDRRLEDLPDDATLAERKKDNRGLSRPEIAVLLAHAKISVYNELLDSNLPDDPLRQNDLVRYFPRPMRDSYAEHLLTHRLRREIIATHVTSSIVNRMGTTFVLRMQQETGRRVSDIARAYTAARDIFELRELWQQVEELDNRVPTEHQTSMMLIMMRSVSAVSRWFLRHGGHPLDLAECLSKYEDGMVIVAAQLESLLPPKAKAKIKRRYKRLRDNDVPDELATRVAAMDLLPATCDVALASHESGVAVERVGKVFFTVGERFGFDRMRRAAELLRGQGTYMQAAASALVDDLSTHQSQLTLQVVRYPGRANQAIRTWTESRPDAVERLEKLRLDFETSDVIDLAMLTVAERELRRVTQM